MIRREHDGIWNRRRAYCDTKARNTWRISAISDCFMSRRRVDTSLSNRPRNALDFACAGCLQLAEAVSSRLFGILIAFPLELGFQALPLIRVHSLEIGVRELAVGSRLSRKQRGIGPANAQFGRWRCFGVDSWTRRQANRGCPDHAVSRLEVAMNVEVTASRIARASGQSQREGNGADGRQSRRQRQQAAQPQLRFCHFATIICTMRRTRDRHVDHSDSRRGRLRPLLATKSRAESRAILDGKFESQSNEHNE
jgi:hypothetical protein